MGSRRGRHAALAAAVAGALAAGSCAAGAPPWFAKGDSWTVPLVGPLEDGLLLVPALVNGHGPYVFAIDPDAQVSIVDQEVATEADARPGEGPHLLDETDRQQTRFYAEILEWNLGTLTIRQRPAQLVPAHTFDAGGRRIHGVIGRDIIADSLVFSFDRDLGVITIATQKSAKVPPNAIPLKYEPLYSRIENVEVLPISRRLVKANINGVPAELHLDLGASPSQLRYRSWTKAKLAESELQLLLADEVGMTRNITKEGVAETVTAGGATSTKVPFVPYDDRRWPDQDLEGTLGLSFFKPYSVMVNWDKETYYLSPRRDVLSTLQARLGRWQSKRLAACAVPGCVKVTMIDPMAGRPADQMPEKHPGVVITFVRDPNAQDVALEVLVAATPPPGKPAVKWLVANLPADVERAMVHVSADYLDATLTTLDMSLFPRECPAQGGCVDMVLPPQELDPKILAKSPEPAASEPAAAPPEPAPAPTETPPGQ
ncbi:MAG: hypothetical protein HOV81_27260 [Kofleriaceae bacterium]|nr:hypothetical protein [Kofleriaceae bacterium]